MNRRYQLLSMALLAALWLGACTPPATPVPTATSAPPTVAPATKAPATAAATTAPTTPPTVAATSTTAGGLTAADVNQALTDKFNTVDRNLVLWNIQPGLGTVMIEYGNRLARLWYATNADNWDMAKYQLDEMTEIQEVGETTRPKRAEPLKNFEDEYLAPIDAAIAAQDKDAFTTAFNDAISGCNACHTSSTGDEWASYQYVEVQVPTSDPAYYVDWQGGDQGNYIANPSPSASATPPTLPEGPLDAAGITELVNAKFDAVDRSLALWNIQPGLGTVMMEYGLRWSRLWFASQAGNWDMARYQFDEMLEIQEVGEITRPGRAEMLKNFEDSYLGDVESAIEAQDATAFETAYNAGIEGCNACHKASKGSEWTSYQFVKIQAPQGDNSDFIMWQADKLTGNYIPNPPPAAATPTAGPVFTHTLDATGLSAFIDTKLNTLDRTLALWNIQPGLGTVMIEYSNRMARLRYAINAGNWDMATYQLDEMLEIQEVAETTRPGRAEMLKNFEDSYLVPLRDAVLANDATAADTAYTDAIDGCNACHTSSKGAEWSSYAYIQFQDPPSDPADYLNWATEHGTGNYKP